jgi:hypothetical protein
MKAGREKRTLGPGEFVIVEPGTPHRFWNAGDEPVTFVCEIRPALQFESLLETMFALAAAGKTNRKGMPNLLRLAVIAEAHFDTVRLAVPAGLAAEGRARARRAARAAGWIPAAYQPEPGLAAPATA